MSVDTTQLPTKRRYERRKSAAARLSRRAISTRLTLADQAKLDAILSATGVRLGKWLRTVVATALKTEEV